MNLCAYESMVYMDKYATWCDIYTKMYRSYTKQYIICIYLGKFILFLFNFNSYLNKHLHTLHT